MNPLWYFGNISRTESEKVLSACGRSVLLVRESSVPNHFALSRYDANRNVFGHELIAKIGGGFAIKDSPSDNTVYPSIEELLRRSSECSSFEPLGRYVSPNSGQAPNRQPPPRMTSPPPTKTARNPPFPQSNQPEFLQRGTAAVSNTRSEDNEMNPLWFFGSISRQDAELMLSSCGVDCLLVRTSSVTSHFALSRYDRASNIFSHQLIAPSVGGYKIEECPYDKNTYPSVDSLINQSTECIGFIPLGKLIKNTYYNPPPIKEFTKSASSLGFTPPPRQPSKTLSGSSIPNVRPLSTSAGNIQSVQSRSDPPPRALSPPPRALSPPPVSRPVSQPPPPSSPVDSKKKEKEEKLRKQKEEKLKKEQDKKQLKKRNTVMVIEGPTNVKHLSHVGFNGSDGFQIRNIPTEWKVLFQNAGVKKSDLKDPDTALFIMSTISESLSGRGPPPPPNFAPQGYDMSPAPPTFQNPPPPPFKNSQNPSPPGTISRGVPPSPPGTMSRGVPPSPPGTIGRAPPPPPRDGSGPMPTNGNFPPPRPDFSRPLVSNGPPMPSRPVSAAPGSITPGSFAPPPMPPRGDRPPLPPRDGSGSLVPEVPPPPMNQLQTPPMRNQRLSAMVPPNLDFGSNIPPPPGINIPPPIGSNVPPPPAPPSFAPPPPAPVETGPANPLLNALVNAQLKAVESGSLPPLEAVQSQNLLSTLSKAMAERRQNIKEDDESAADEDDDNWDDWS